MSIVSLFVVLSVSLCVAAVGGESLRLCRELSYQYVVSQEAINEFGFSTERAIDQQLMVRYNDMSQNQLATQQCLFHWKNLMCSHVFRTTQNAKACNSLCVAAGNACTAQTPNFCATQGAALCTDYAALTGFCAATVDIVDSSAPPSPSPPRPVTGDAATTVTLSIATLTIILTSVHFWLQQ